MTGSLFISERKKGLLDRSLVAGKQKRPITHFPYVDRNAFHIGASMIEILLANLINQFIVLLGQTALVFVFVSVVFEIPCLGSAALAVCLAVLQGLVGICYGIQHGNLYFCRSPQSFFYRFHFRFTAICSV